MIHLLQWRMYESPSETPITVNPFPSSKYDASQSTAAVYPRYRSQRRIFDAVACPARSFQADPRWNVLSLWKSEGFPARGAYKRLRPDSFQGFSSTRSQEGSAVGWGSTVWKGSAREENRSYAEITSVEETTVAEGASEHRASIAT